jgi:hypothetical protein
MKFAVVLAATVLAAAPSVLLISCAKQSTTGQHATLLLRDGTNVSGTVISNSASEIQIAGDDKITRTIPVTQVRSIQYDDTAASTTAAALQPLASRSDH